MSNIWTYELFFKEDSDVRDRIFSFFEVMKSNDIIYMDQHNQIEIDLADLKEYKELEFNSLDSAIDFLMQKGGMVQVRKILDRELDWDYDFYIHYRDPFLSIRSENLQPKIPKINNIAISVGAHLYRKADAEDKDPMTIAPFIKKLFGDYCTSQDAIYGFSSDENMSELYINSFPGIIPRIISKSPPPILFWLNYFSKEYLSVIDPEFILSQNGKFEILENGAFVTFYDYPWEVKYQNLKKINERWEGFTA